MRALPSASTSFLSHNLSQTAFYLFQVLIFTTNGSHLDHYLALHPSTLNFIHLSNFIFWLMGSSRWGLTHSSWWHRIQDLTPAYLLSFCNCVSRGDRLTVIVLSAWPQNQACSVFKLILNYYPVHHNLQLKNMFLKANIKQHHHPKKHHRVKHRW